MALYSLSQQQFLLGAINEANPGAVVPASFDNAVIGIPKAITPTVTGGPDTEIALRGRQGRGYVGKQTFHYTRLSLNNIFRNMVPTVTAPGAYGYLNTVAAKMAFALNLNGRYGLNLVPEDIPDQYVVLNTLNTLRINSTSIQYTGSFQFHSTLGKNSLDELLVNDILPVMNHPIDPTAGKVCVTLLGYGIDFTDEPQVMQAFVNGRMDVGVNATSGHSDNLLHLLSSHGLPEFNYTGAIVKRIKPSEDSRANTRYDNVLVITNINDPAVAGDWLLHYNN